MLVVGFRLGETPNELEEVPVVVCVLLLLAVGEPEAVVASGGGRPALPPVLCGIL